MKKCQNCGKQITSNLNQYFCSSACRGESMRGERSPQYKGDIDLQLKLLTRLYGDNLPRGTLTELAKIFGVSKERIRQRAKRLGFTPINKIRTKTPCVVCGKEFEKTPLSMKKFCSSECRIEMRNIRFNTLRGVTKCEVCSKEILYRKARGKPRFCSKVCHGSWLGKQLKSKPNPKRGDSLSMVILRSIFGKKPFTTKDLMKHYGYRNLFLARSRINYLLGKKKIKTVYKGRPTYYILVEDIDK